MDNKPHKSSRRDFIRKSTGLILGTATVPLALSPIQCALREKKAVVSISKIKDDNINYAVEEAIDLLGGINRITKGKERIMLKPNLLAEGRNFTTKPEVIKALAQLMKKAGKEVLIGEGSATAGGFNATEYEAYRTTNRAILDGMQQYVFDQLGYTELSKNTGIPLINLHSGEMTEVAVPDAFVYNTIILHQSLADIDLLCSVPMMKTHALATVTLGMKNMIGLYPGTKYCSVRACVHDDAAAMGSPGIAYEIIDMVKANKLGLTIIDGSMAMEGDGPTDGNVIKMDVIVAGTNPLATDMVGASLMGFDPQEVPTLALAYKTGMGPGKLDEIEIRGEKIDTVRRYFKKPNVIPWAGIRNFWGVKEI